jgi:hypothetical protein
MRASATSLIPLLLLPIMTLAKAAILKKLFTLYAVPNLTLFTIFTF